MECNELLERKMTRGEGGDDKLVLFRQQVLFAKKSKLTRIYFEFTLMYLSA